MQAHFLSEIIEAILLIFLKRDDQHINKGVCNIICTPSYSPFTFIYVFTLTGIFSIIKTYDKSRHGHSQKILKRLILNFPFKIVDN